MLFAIKTIKGVQRILRNYCNSRKISTTLVKKNESSSDIEELLRSDREYNEIADEFVHLTGAHRCLIIQPYVKWGPRKLRIKPQEQLEEAVALIHTLPHWKVIDTITIPLETLERKSLFKSGNMDKLVNLITKNSDITAVFINASNLKKVTTNILQENFRLPILDRYKIVMQILKMHATSKYAKLQVALAELYFVQHKTETSNFFITHDRETLKLMFQNREHKLKRAIQDLRNQRSLLRSKRTKLEFPIIAVVGYTNAGKTCLIKALTGEESLKPRNQLFATLDVTVHAGVLPSGLEVLYVDTVGFLSDLPANLIECFVATLEDAMLADVILHVEDLSSSSFEYKREHVLKTLKSLSEETNSTDILDKVISVGNKCDIENDNKHTVPISAKLGIGLDQLRTTLERAVLEATSRHVMTIKVPNGGEEIRWLYKNATIVSENPDENDPQKMKTKVIITEPNLQKFKYHFLLNNSNSK